MSRKALFFLLILVPAIVTKLHAQPTRSDATQRGETVAPVTLGQSVGALNGPWKFHVGDNPRWADPEFDDSEWQSYEILPGHSVLTPEGITQSVALPGWHGNPGYTGYAWYRLRVQLPNDVASLALLMPQHVDDAYEVYLNGSKIGAFGNLNGWPLSYRGRPHHA